MILHEFPNLQWLKAQAETRFSNRTGVGGIQLVNAGWPTVVLNAKARGVVRDNIRGPLSIFTNLSGTSYVTVEKKRTAVSSETFFISNTGQPYTLEVDDKASSETFNIHFGEQFVGQALQSIGSAPAQLLENKSGQKEFGFHNRVVPNSPEFYAIVRALKAHGTDPLFLEEKLFQLLTLLIAEETQVREMHNKLSAVKATTKDEILKRLTCATDYLYTFYTLNPGLDELAEISCLSKFHFLRLFKIAHGQTPHQFMLALKIKRAKDLLRKSKDDVKSIAHDLGFGDASAFSRLFYNRTGVYPSQFRAGA